MHAVKKNWTGARQTDCKQLFDKVDIALLDFALNCYKARRRNDAIAAGKALSEKVSLLQSTLEADALIDEIVVLINTNLLLLHSLQLPELFKCIALVSESISFRNRIPLISDIKYWVASAAEKLIELKNSALFSVPELYHSFISHFIVLFQIKAARLLEEEILLFSYAVNRNAVDNDKVSDILISRNAIRNANELNNFVLNPALKIESFKNMLLRLRQLTQKTESPGIPPDLQYSFNDNKQKLNTLIK